MFNKKSVMYSSTTTAGIFLATMLILAPSIAMAANGSPHFVGSATATATANHSVTISFKIAGLSEGEITTVTVSSTGGTADVQCVNPGGNNPPPKRVTFGPITNTVSLPPAPKNGNLQGSVTLTAPTITSAQAGCPNPNWSVTINSVTYNGLSISATTSQHGGTITTSVQPSSITS
jgi:hypothetical protein